MDTKKLIYNILSFLYSKKDVKASTRYVELQSSFQDISHSMLFRVIDHLAEKGYISKQDLVFSESKQPTGEKVFRIEVEGMLYFESRRSYYKKFLYWLKDDNNLKWLLGLLFAFCSGLLIGYLTKKV